jgi:hypothetical protein
VYVGVLTAVVALATGASTRFHTAVPGMAAFALYRSDLSVARDRFVARGFVHRAWGLPLDFAAQLGLARTVRDIGRRGRGRGRGARSWPTGVVLSSEEGGRP